MRRSAQYTAGRHDASAREVGWSRGAALTQFRGPSVGGARPCGTKLLEAAADVSVCSPEQRGFVPKRDRHDGVPALRTDRELHLQHPKALAHTHRRLGSFERRDGRRVADRRRRDAPGGGAGGRRPRRCATRRRSPSAGAIPLGGCVGCWGLQRMLAETSWSASSVASASSAALPTLRLWTPSGHGRPRCLAPPQRQPVTGGALRATFSGTQCDP